MGLIRVQDDRARIRVRRVGRFAIERELVSLRDSERAFEHLLAAVQDMEERMVRGLQLHGYVYVDEGFALAGPLPHVAFGADARPDPGPNAEMPDPRDYTEIARYERTEKARAARALGGPSELVDFTLTATFERAVPISFHTAAPGRTSSN